MTQNNAPGTGGETNPAPLGGGDVDVTAASSGDPGDTAFTTDDQQQRDDVPGIDDSGAFGEGGAA